MERGHGLAKEVGYVPLNDREEQLVRDRYKAGTKGTMYAGAKPGQSLESLLAPPAQP